jgi:copper(I)-binding protein
MKKMTLKALLATTVAALAAVTTISSAEPTPMLLAHAGHDHAKHAASAHGHGSAHSSAAFEAAKPAESITVTQCWIRSIPLPAPSAGYFVVKNGGGKEVKLVAAASSVYGMVMLHRTTHEGGMSRMSEAQDIAIPAGGELAFKPGGYHAMLEKPATAPKVGDKVQIDFLFDNGQKTGAECEVKPANTKSL